MSQKTIWHLVSNRWNSAITEYALSSAKALAGRGYTSIFSALEGSSAKSRAKACGLETLSLPGFSLMQVPQLLKIERAIHADCVLLYGGQETFLSKFIGVKKQIRFFGQDLRTPFLRFPGFLSSYSHIEKILVPNQIIAEQVRSCAIGKPCQRIILGLASLPWSSQNESARTFDLTILGRLDPIKGHEPFLHIFSLLCEQWPKALTRPLLHIVGEQANLSCEDLEAMALKHSLLIGKDLILTGERLPKVAPLLQQTGIGVIPSLGSEHICRVAEEFLLAGTPLFVSGAGATEEVLFPGAGETYRAKTASAAAEQLLHLVLRVRDESPSVRRDRAAYARSCFSLDRMGSELENFIFA